MALMLSEGAPDFSGLTGIAGSETEGSIGVLVSASRETVA